MDSLLRLLNSSQPGHTPLLSLNEAGVNWGVKAWLKDESRNPSGSSKARPAFQMLKAAIQKGDVTKTTTLVESSSGNMAIALAHYACRLGIQFHCFTDDRITPTNRRLIELYQGRESITEVRVTDNDPVEARLAELREFCKKHKNAHWIHQYENPHNPKAYSIAVDEILTDCPNVQFVIIPVSTGGTGAGFLSRFRELGLGVQVILIDAIGSNALGLTPLSARFVPGFGSSKPSHFLPQETAHRGFSVSAEEAVQAVRSMAKHGFLLGGTSGAGCAACQRFVGNVIPEGSEVVIFCPDSGERYVDTLFDDQWLLDRGIALKD